jgi:exopolyphosphatase
MHVCVQEALRDENSGRSLHVVLGNESADMDSVVSAMVIAAHRTEMDRAHAAPGASVDIVVPVVNVAREELPLRTDIAFLFQSVLGVDLSALLCVDEVPLQALAESGRLRLTLVDHNQLALGLEALEASVVDIVDHHVDSGRCAAAKRTIAMVGSCCTLVAELLERDQSPLMHNGHILQLLMSAILMDTINLNQALGRTTAQDLLAYEALERHVPLPEPRTQWFDTLVKSRVDVSRLTASQLLRKDYKETRAGRYRLGVASCAISLNELFTHDKGEPPIDVSLRRYAESRGLDVLVVMAVSHVPEFRRELLVSTAAGGGAVLHKLLTDYLQSSSPTVADLRLTPARWEWDATAAAAASARQPLLLSVYDQGNVQASRKIVLPALDSFLSTLDAVAVP